MKTKLGLLELILLSVLTAVVVYAIALDRKLDAARNALGFSGTCSSISELHFKVIRDNELACRECEFLYRVDGKLFSLNVQGSGGYKPAWWEPAKIVLTPLEDGAKTD